TFAPGIPSTYRKEELHNYMLSMLWSTVDGQLKCEENKNNTANKQLEQIPNNNCKQKPPQQQQRPQLQHPSFEAPTAGKYPQPQQKAKQPKKQPQRQPQQQRPQQPKQQPQQQQPQPKQQPQQQQSLDIDAPIAEKPKTMSFAAYLLTKKQQPQQEQQEQQVQQQ